MARRALSWLVSGTALLVALCGSAGAHAQPALQAAQRAFDEGDRAEKKGDCATAVLKFEEAMAIVETPQLRMRAGRCKEKLGRRVEAVGDYQRATVLAQSDPELLALAQAQLQGALPRVPKLRFKLPVPRPEELAISVDGKAVADVDSDKLVDPGTHPVKVTARGHHAFEAQVLAEEGKVSVLEVKLTRVELPPPTTPPPASFDPVPFILLGSAGAALGASIGLGAYSFVLAQDLVDQLPAGCRQETQFDVVCDTAELPELESKKVEQNVVLGLSVGAAIISAGLLTTSITMLGTAPDAPAKAGRARAVPWFGPEGAGLGVAIDL